MNLNGLAYLTCTLLCKYFLTIMVIYIYVKLGKTLPKFLKKKIKSFQNILLETLGVVTWELLKMLRFSIHFHMHEVFMFFHLCFFY